MFAALDRERARIGTGKIAVKVLNRKSAEDPENAQRLIREFRCMQQLAHPGIAKVLDLACDTDPCFLTMELLDGQPLNRRLKTSLSAQSAFRILTECAEALAYAHEQGVVHGDLKPGNVFVVADGTVRLLDFGSASDRSESPAPRHSLATPAYASPQVLQLQAPDGRDDLFSLGCVAYELFSAKHPFERLSSREAHRRNLRPAWVPSIPARYFAHINRLLAWERDDRPGSAREFLEGLIAAERRFKAALVRDVPRPATPAKSAAGKAESLIDPIARNVTLADSKQKTGDARKSDAKAATHRKAESATPEERSDAESKPAEHAEHRVHAPSEEATRAFKQFAGVVPDSWVGPGVNLRPVGVRIEPRVEPEIELTTEEIEAAEPEAPLTHKPSIRLSPPLKSAKHRVEVLSRWMRRRHRRQLRKYIPDNWAESGSRLHAFRLQAQAFIASRTARLGAAQHSMNEALSRSRAATQRAASNSRTSLQHLWRKTVESGAALHRRAHSKAINSSSRLFEWTRRASTTSWMKLRQVPWRKAIPLISFSWPPPAQWRPAIPVAVLAGLGIMIVLLLQLNATRSGAERSVISESRLHALASKPVVILMPEIAPLPAPTLASASAANTVRSPGRVSFQSARVHVGSAQRMAVINLQRERSTEGSARVSWSIAAASARPGVDFDYPTAQVARFNDGQTVRSLYIPIKRPADSRSRGERRFKIKLKQAPGGPALGAITETEVVIAGTG